MPSSIAEIAIAIKITELAKRIGLSASDVDGFVTFLDEEKDPEGRGYYRISFVDTGADPERKGKFYQLLGMHNTEVLVGPELQDLEDKVDHALSLAPRVRTLG
jgi:hypothetical protein